MVCSLDRGSGSEDSVQPFGIASFDGSGEKAETILVGGVWCCSLFDEEGEVVRSPLVIVGQGGWFIADEKVDVGAALKEFLGPEKLLLIQSFFERAAASDIGLVDFNAELVEKRKCFTMITRERDVKGGVAITIRLPEIDACSAKPFDLNPIVFLDCFSDFRAACFDPHVLEFAKRDGWVFEVALLLKN